MFASAVPFLAIEIIKGEVMENFVSILIILGLTLISYGIGCFSTARFIAKSFKSLNIYKVGTGHPDTQNIYSNIGKILGVFAGLVDFTKVYFYLILLKFVFNQSEIVDIVGDVGSEELLFVYGFGMILGHCLPVTHRFKGGRGLFTYMGFIAFFVPFPIIIVAILTVIFILVFKQIRFAQYMIVILPPFIISFFGKFLGYNLELDTRIFVVAAIMMAVINVVVSKKKGEI